MPAHSTPRHNKYETIGLLFMGFLAFVAIALTAKIPKQKFKSDVMVFKLPQRCMPAFVGYVAVGHHSIMPTNKFLHMREMLIACEAGKNVADIPYSGVTKGDIDAMGYKKILDQGACGGAPCPRSPQ